jgi:hypothetical protein
VPYHPWLQFLRQKASLLTQEYASRAPGHCRQSDFRIYLPQDAAILPSLPAWVRQTAAGLEIDVTGMASELFDAIESYEALLEGTLSHVPSIIRPSAVGAVVYDTHRDRLYYGTSGFIATMTQMRVHQDLIAREQTLPLTVPNGVRTLVGTRSPRTCSEFKAFNRALLDGAQEKHLHLWTFRVRDMRPIPRCPNCRVTIPTNRLAKTWTG